jgi:TolA-binding protein
MKRFPLMLTLLASLVALPVVAEAKDKKKDHDDDNGKKEDSGKKEDKETQKAVHELEQEYSRVRDRVRNSNAGPKASQELQAIGSQVDRVRQIAERGNYDPRELRGRIHQLNDSLDRLTQQLQSSNRSRGQGAIYIERKRDGDRR